MSDSKPVARMIAQVPPNLICDAQRETASIDWANLLGPDRRSRTPIFRTSTAIHLRVHQVTNETPDTLAAHAEIVECIDTAARSKFPAVNALIEWAYREIRGHHLGRAMIVKLDPFGSVGVHVDRGRYFQFHKRLHIPLLTSSRVIFYGEDYESTKANMSLGWLCQLHNDRPHGVVSYWSKDRVHLIIDIASEDARLQD